MATGIGPPDFGVFGNVLFYGGAILLPVLLFGGGAFVLFKIISIIIKDSFPKKEITKEEVNIMNAEKEAHEIKIKNEESYKNFL
jgi:hypothetical protein